jgi:hypothetical protein
MHPREQPTPTERPSRYAVPRKLLRWRTPHLAVLKMLAWAVREQERTNTQQLWTRCDKLCPQIVAAVLGESDVTLDAICEHTLAEQGAPITPSKLMQRADKASRYRELNDFADAVVAAYRDAAQQS